MFRPVDEALSELAANAAPVVVIVMPGIFSMFSIPGMLAMPLPLGVGVGAATAAAPLVATLLPFCSAHIESGISN
jgi:hypothetical protein